MSATTPLKHLFRNTLRNEEAVECYRKFKFYTFRRHVLELGAGFYDIGGVRWPLFGLMALLWCIIYFCIWRGLTNARYVSQLLSLNLFFALF